MSAPPPSIGALVGLHHAAVRLQVARLKRELGLAVLRHSAIQTELATTHFFWTAARHDRQVKLTVLGARITRLRLRIAFLTHHGRPVAG